jgi:isopentenyl phosphate kinase
MDAHADVTGGMGKKIDTMKNISRLGIDTILLNGNKKDILYNVLIGEDAKRTIIYGDKK